MFAPVSRLLEEHLCTSGSTSVPLTQPTGLPSSVTLLRSFSMEPVQCQCSASAVPLQCSAVNNRMLLNLAQSTLSYLLLSTADIFYFVSSKVVAVIRFHLLLDFFTSKPTE